MRSHARRTLASLFVLLVTCHLSLVTSALALPQNKPQLPSPMGYVSDHAGVIDPAWKERIRSVCQDLERKTGVEMVVVTVPSTQPFATAKDYAAALYERWLASHGYAGEKHVADYHADDRGGGRQ
jgi:uncharacterized membrane protein YgcG